MKTLDQAFKAANKGPVSVDNNLMIVAADGDYLAKIDASEGSKWRASAALLVHGFNQIRAARNALVKAHRVIEGLNKDGSFDVPGDLSHDQIEIEDFEPELKKLISELDQVKEIGERVSWQVRADHPILARPDRVFHGDTAEDSARLFAKDLAVLGFENIVVAPWREE
jgi:hypothetical protein